MRRPIFRVHKWKGYFPYVFVCRKPYYQAVFMTVEEGKLAVEARFGSCLFRVDEGI